MKNKNIKALMLGLMAFVAPMVSAKIVTLDELYEQSTVIERVASIKQLEIAVNPSEPGILAGQVLLPNEDESVSKLDLKILSESGEIFWEQSILNPVAADFNFSHTIPTSFPKTDLNFVAQVWNEDYLFAAGQVSYENVGTKKSIPLLLSDISAEIQDSLLKVILSGKSLKKNEGISAEVKVYEVGSNKVLIERVSKPRSVSEGGNPAFELEFEKPKKAGVYTVIGSLLDGSKKSITGSVKSTFIVDGTFATLKKINTTPQKFLTAGESVTVLSSGKVNKNLAEVEIEVEVRSVQGAVLDTETLTVPVNRFKEFEFSHTFSVSGETEGLVGTVKVLSKGDIVLEKKFESLVFPKFADSGVTTAPEKNANTPTETKNPQNKSQKLLMTGLGVAILLILIFVLIMVFKKKKPNSSNTLSMFILLLAIGVYGPVFAATSLACDPDNVVINGSNAHCQFFGDEVYNGVSVDDFGKIPLAMTTVNTSDGTGYLTVGEDYTVTAITCENAGCTSLNNAAATKSFTAERTKSFDVELAASDFFNETDSEKNIRIKQFVVTDSSSAAVVTLDFALNSLYELKIDNKVPELAFTRKNTTTEFANAVLAENPVTANFYDDSGANAIQNNFTKDAVKVEIGCLDTGAGCLSDSYAILVEGNFCGDDGACTIGAGARKLKVCDKVGNCTTGDTSASQIIVKNYDIGRPRSGVVSSGEKLRLQGTAGGGAANAVITTGGTNALKAFQEFILKIEEVKDVDLEEGGILDFNACGKTANNGDDGIVSLSGTCAEVSVSCANSSTQRGISTYASNPPIPSFPGYQGCVSAGCPADFTAVSCGPTDIGTNCCAAPTGTEITCNTQFDYCFPIKLN